MVPSLLPAFSAPKVVSAGPPSCLASSAVTAAMDAPAKAAASAATRCLVLQFMGMSPVRRRFFDLRWGRQCRHGMGESGRLLLREEPPVALKDAVGPGALDDRAHQVEVGRFDDVELGLERHQRLAV